MFVTLSSYKRLKRLFREYRNKKVFKIIELKRHNKTLEDVIKTQKQEIEKLREQKKECIQKVMELKQTNEKIRENYQKLSNKRMECEKELHKIKELYEDLKKETFGYNFFSKVASKKALLEALKNE